MNSLGIVLPPHRARILAVILATGFLTACASRTPSPPPGGSDRVEADGTEVRKALDPDDPATPAAVHSEIDDTWRATWPDCRADPTRPSGPTANGRSGRATPIT